MAEYAESLRCFSAYSAISVYSAFYRRSQRATPKDNRMKILMMTPGGWIHSQRTLNCLLERGQEVTLVDSFNPYPEGRKGYSYIRYPRTGERHYRKFINSEMSDRLSLRITAAQLNLLWRRLKPDVVHVCWLDARAFHCLEAGLRPLVLSVWGSDVNVNLLPDADPKRSRIAGQALAGADLTIVDAPDMTEKCSRLVGRDIATEQLHLGVDTTVFRRGYFEEAMEWRRRLQIPRDARVLVSIRALRRNHNHHLILEAFAQAVAQVPSDIFLVFKVYDLLEPAYEAELRRRAEELGIGKLVRWIEDAPFARLPEIYALADVIINYPSMDAFPVTFMEAAACERPVITCRLPSYTGGIAEKYFRMIPSENTAALAGAIVEFVCETLPAENNSVARLAEARREVELKYDEAVYAGRLIGIYEELSPRMRWNR